MFSYLTVIGVTDFVYLWSWISKSNTNSICLLITDLSSSHFSSHFPTPHPYYYLSALAWGQPNSLFSCRKKLFLSVPFTRWSLSRSTSSGPDFLLVLAQSRMSQLLSHQDNLRNSNIGTTFHGNGNKPYCYFHYLLLWVCYFLLLWDPAKVKPSWC